MNHQLLADGVEFLYDNGMAAEAQAINDALASKPDTIAATRQFMLAAGQTILPRPGQPAPQVLKLRLALELEELYEKAQAFGMELTFRKMLVDKSAVELDCDDDDAVIHFNYGDTRHCKDSNIYNAVEVLDACADQRVVADGTILACGLQECFTEAMAEVHRSNMSKFPTTMEEAGDTVADYLKKGVDVVCDMGLLPGTPMPVKRRSDGKILKSINYSPASLQPILDKHSG